MQNLDPHQTAPLLERQFSRLLGQTSSLIARQVADCLEKMDSNRHQFAVLATLDAFGADSQAGISRRTRIDRSDMVAALSALEANGLVARAVDATDRRRNVVQITAPGRAKVAALSAVLEQAQLASLSPLSADERKTLAALLTRLRDHHSRLAQTGPSGPSYTMKTQPEQ